MGPKGIVMISLEVLLLGLALAIDAAVVCFALALSHTHLHINHRMVRGGTLALIFGLFQFLMLWLGSYGGFLLSFSSFGHLFQLVVTVIFTLIGIKFFQESFEEDPREFDWGLLPILTLGLATSIDAMAAGVSLGTLPGTHLIALQVGGLTFITCSLFYSLGMVFKKIPDKWLLRLAGMVFFGLAGRTIWEQF